MSRLPRTLTAVALCVALSVGAGIASASAAGVGVVLVHLRGSWPGFFDNIAPKLQAAGYATIAPEMCWSVRKLYSATLEKCLEEIDVAIAGLKGRGMDRIVLAGHDSGGVAAAYYTGTRKGVDGLVVWGPRANTRAAGDEDLKLAVSMVAEGNGDRKGNFNNGRMYATANELLSFEGPSSPFADQDALFRKVSVPLLWMAANDDTGPRDPSARFKLAQPNALSSIVWSRTDQYSMIDVSIADVIGWLDKFQAATVAK